MDDKKQFRRRLTVIGALFLLVLVIYVSALYEAQIVHGAEYRARSIRANTRSETVVTSRGILTDRNGKVLVSNRSVYTLELDLSLASSDDETLNADLMRLMELLDRRGIAWEDTLPLSSDAPFSYDFNAAGSGSHSALNRYLVSKKWAASDDLTTDEDPPLTPERLLSLLKAEFQTSDDLTGTEARRLLGLRYALAVAKLDQRETVSIASDISVELITELKDGDYAPIHIGTSSVREYQTDAAAHILGRITKIPRERWNEYKEKGYAMNAYVGYDGVELAFEDYLRGRNGRRIVETNTAGKVTGEIYSVEPEPGNTVALTLDIDFQEDVERILAETVEGMTAEDGIGRGAAAAVVQVGTGEVLALASYPTFSLKTFNEDYMENYEDPLNPFWNRATQETYAPGSTFKPVTAIAALETGIITPHSKILTRGVYHYGTWAYKCWLYNQNGGTHGSINVTEAIKVSCNYFFYDVGRMTGISNLARYAYAFGLGEPTGIEIPESIGVMTTPDYVNSLDGHYWTDGQTLTAAIGQSYSRFTPLQLANYIATLANGGTRFNAHLLKSVKTYDNSAPVAVYDEPPAEIIDIDPENRRAVLQGMRDLVVSGSVAYYFKDCVVDAAAKTGTAQTGSGVSNGVFVAFAPYDDPQIAVAVVIEKGRSGSALASTTVQILNSYFTSADAEKAVAGENTLLR